MSMPFAVEKFCKFVQSAPDWFILEFAVRLTGLPDNMMDKAFVVSDTNVQHARDTVIKAIGDNPNDCASTEAAGRGKLAGLYKGMRNWMIENDAPGRAGAIWAKMMTDSFHFAERRHESQIHFGRAASGADVVLFQVWELA